MQRLLIVLAVLATALAAGSAFAANVKITPLGSHDGEFCARDRALIFEDPDGTRILYDAGLTVRGADDPRLGKIDAVLLSHAHADHLGSAHQKAANAGTCASLDLSVKDTPNSNSLNIVMAKKALFLLGGEMQRFFATKLKRLGSDPGLAKVVRFGGSYKVGKVEVASVPAVHSNGLEADFLDNKQEAEMMKDLGLTVYLGPPGGYVLSFSNGLVVYLSGDTGIEADQELVVRGHYHANLTVMNIGGTFSTGPVEAAYVINDLVKPASVIASHANEVATKGGKVIPGTRTDTFIKATKVPVYIPLSGKTMEFDGHGKCVGGCM